jgi:hypothetical protein
MESEWPHCICCITSCSTNPSSFFASCKYAQILLLFSSWGGEPSLAVLQIISAWEMGHGLVNCPWARPRNGKWDGREQGKRLRDFIISRSHCPFCLGKKECRSIGSHKNANGADACSLGSRLRRLVMRVREIQGPRRQSHGDFLRTILHSENEFNLFCQKQVIAIGANNGTRGRA